jgi:hypothetical protein
MSGVLGANGGAPKTWTWRSRWAWPWRQWTNDERRRVVQQRLDEISHEAQSAGQFGPAVRAEELLGKSVGLFIDRSILLSGTMNDSHIAALIELARKRQQEPIDLADDASLVVKRHVAHRKHDDDDG